MTEPIRSVNLKLISKISERIDNQTLKITDIPEGDADLMALSAVLYGCTPTQVFLWVIIFIHSIENHRPSMVDIARHLKVKTINALAFLSELEELKRKKLVRFSKPRRSECRTSLTFVIPTNVMDNIVYGITDHKELYERDVFSFLSILQGIIEDYEQQILSFEEFITRLEDLKLDFHELNYVKTITGLNNLRQEENLLILNLSLFALKGCSADIDAVITSLTPQDHINFRLKRLIIQGKSLLIKDKIIKLESDDFRGENRISLTNQFINKLFGADAQLLKKKAIDKTNLVKPDSFNEVLLIFNDKFQSKLDVIHELLLPKTFKRIQNQLSSDNQAKGLCILFSGFPGTGKTQSVYQIAKKTGRSIYTVQVTDFKSAYLGESEFNLREVFERYNALVKDSKVCPIMLLNEADAILSTRVTVKRSVDQTMNALQNMLLEFFEKTDGIIICTLNNASNLDKAFSRRFLMKLHFEKPDLETKAKIWKLKFPRLSDTDAMHLATTFDFSGGEMDNVVRKATIAKMIFEKKITLCDLEEFCQEETLDNETRPKVGYRQ